MTTTGAPARVFLFLQGPHGPFFDRLARMLRTAGAEALRVAFNAGDVAFWHDRDRLIAFRGPHAGWPVACRRLIAAHGVTDLVLYGDTRPLHAEAMAAARAANVTVHVFEEGYLRPHWVTYERGGANGHSPLMETPIAAMRAALAGADITLPEAPARWGDMRQHIFYGALYHGHVLLRGGAWPNYRPHRTIPVAAEFRLYLRRLLLLPWHAAERALASARIRHGGFPYHLVLLQLEHDASFRAHGPYATMAEFLAEVVEGFAAGAPRHHHLVFKAHPLEDGRVPVRAEIARLARLHGLKGRVHFVRGGKLAGLLSQARSAVTVNSTAGQQVLWRGLPLAVLGRAVYAKPELVSTRPLAEFFARPIRPDPRAYRDFRHYLLETSQVSGGFYSVRGRRHLLRQVVDLMLDVHDPYEALHGGTAALRQQLHIVVP